MKELKQKGDELENARKDPFRHADLSGDMWGRQIGVSEWALNCLVASFVCGVAILRRPSGKFADFQSIDASIDMLR